MNQFIFLKNKAINLNNVTTIRFKEDKIVVVFNCTGGYTSRRKEHIEDKEDMEKFKRQFNNIFITEY